MRRLREVIRLKRPELRAKTTLDFCITNISPKIWRIWFCNYGIRLIWLRVNNGYSQNSRGHFRERVWVGWKDKKKRWWLNGKRLL